MCSFHFLLILTLIEQSESFTSINQVQSHVTCSATRAGYRVARSLDIFSRTFYNY